MADNSKIEWCDHTFNPWIGCAKVAAGCEHCYAESYARRYGKAVWGPSGTRVKTSYNYWRQPVKWNREAATVHASYIGPTRRQSVFCASLADVFEDWQGPIHDDSGAQLFHDGTERTHEPVTLDDLRSDLFALIDATPHLDWLLLTKRPENVPRMWPGRCTDKDLGGNGCTMTAYRNNVWLLTSVSTQTDADRNIPHLLKCRDLVPVLGVSAEPLLGPVNIIDPIVSCAADEMWWDAHEWGG